MNPPLHVEVVQKQESGACKHYIRRIVHTFLANFHSLHPGTSLRESELEESSEMMQHVETITLCNVEHPEGEDVYMTNTELLYHVFKLDTTGAVTYTLTESASVWARARVQVWALPAQELHSLWESLVFDSRLKDIVRFVENAFKFAERGVDANVVSWNRVVLLHGPPGTGKTSLCRALAQKLSVRLRQRFPFAYLIEINAHSLFSKWFVQSGELVERLFKRVHELLANQRLLAIVLVDEVEFLAQARHAPLAGLEPSDSIHIVNALLTQLDRLQRCPNALVLTTANVTGAIDVAFADRADIKRRVGPPSERAAYEILRSCCAELMARGLVAPRERLWQLQYLEASNWAASATTESSLRLWEVARAAAEAQLSGRALRRLPLLARTLHALPEAVPLLAFVAALRAALQQHLQDSEDFRAVGVSPDVP